MKDLEFPQSVPYPESNIWTVQKFGNFYLKFPDNEFREKTWLGVQ